MVTKELLRCPKCRSPLDTPVSRVDSSSTVQCRGASPHQFAVNKGIIHFTDDAATDAKYRGDEGDAMARRYAATIAYAYESLNLGSAEGLYRTVASLAVQTLLSQPRPNVLVVGCGVGREVADLSAFRPDATILALDASPAMADYARRIVVGSGPVDIDVSEWGFGIRRIRGRAAANAQFCVADANHLPIADATTRLVISVNVICRVPGGPAAALKEMSRALAPGGSLVLTTPLNWRTSELWAEFGTVESLLTLMDQSGFSIEEHFDDLPYTEVVDKRHSYDVWRSLVVRAVKRG